MKKAVKHLEQFLEQAEGLHEGEGRARDRVRRRARHRQVARQHDPLEQRLHRVRPRQAGAGEHDHREGARGERRRDRPVGAAREHVEADAAVRAGARPARPQDSGADRRRGDQSPIRPARAVRRGRARVRLGRLLLQGRVRGAGDDGRACRAATSVARDTTAKLLDDARNDAFLTATVGKDVRSGIAGGDEATCRTITPFPAPPFWGTKVLEDIPLDEVFALLDLDELYRLQWGGRGSATGVRRAGEGAVRAGARATRRRGDARRLARRRRRSTATSQCRALGNDLDRLRSRGVSKDGSSCEKSHASTSRDRKVASVSASPTTSDRRESGTSTSLRFRSSRSATTATRRFETLQAAGEYSEAFYSHGLAVEAAEGGGRVDASPHTPRAGSSRRPRQAVLVGLRRMSGSRGSRAALQDSSRRRGARHGAHERVPAHSRAEHGGDHRAPSAAKYYAVRGEAT